jgi:hypothetical protein
MKYAGHIVRKGLIAKLLNAVSYSGSFVPVYGRVPDNATYPYIKIGDAEMGEVDQNQSTFVQNINTLIEVVSRFDSDTGGGTESDLITNLVMQLIRTRSSGYMDLSADGFSVYTQTIGFVNKIEESQKDYYYYRSIINIDIRVEQV